MNRNDFAVFILTHGRPDKVITYSTIRRLGYTGPIYLIVDDQDSRRYDYEQNYQGEVIVFDKEKVIAETDTGDNQGDYRSVIYARNACHDIAKDLGYTYFIQLDDDYTGFGYRYLTDGKFIYKRIRKLDAIFEALLEYYISIPALSIAIAQGGDFIGGDNSFIGTIRTRKAMNSFLCSTERPFKFIGKLNDDVNTYTHLGFKGHLFMTIPMICLFQMTTQQNSGGLTELYLEEGTYVKSFYSILYTPSAVRVGEIGQIHKRLHHRISWNNTVPKIINPEHQRPR